MRSWSRLATSSRASLSRVDDGLLARGALVAARLGVVEGVGVEAGLEELDEAARDAGVGDEGRLDVVLRERRAGLAQVLRDGAQDDDLAPGQPGAQHERVEAVGLGVAVPDRPEGVLEALPDVVGRSAPVPHVSALARSPKSKMCSARLVVPPAPRRAARR